MADHKDVVIVSGGTHGIGLATTVKLAAQDKQVVAFGLDARQAGSTAELTVQRALALCAELGHDVDVFEADVSDEAAVHRVVEHCVDTYGRVDGLVNNAAVYPAGTILDTPREVWDRTVGVNLSGLYLTVRAVLPHMLAQGRGSIVNVASRASWGQPRLFAYSATKGGVLSATYALAYDHQDEGVRVNAVVPGLVRSGMTEELGIDFEDPRFHSVAGRVAEPEDVANAIAFLLSDDAAVITGAVLNVNSFAGQGGARSADTRVTTGGLDGPTR